ncbi:MAG: hypothetical protein EOO06_16410 [Chitinophagaceae bacterium]|nr:MAG: hypothetical protein EOO06_16410 [Chitinophagaceae bacterium]
MKKILYVSVLPLLLISAVLVGNRSFQKADKLKASVKGTAAASNPERTQWEATPAGIAYKKWERSPGGRAVFRKEEKVSAQIKGFKDIEAVVTNLSLPEGSRLGLGMMVKILDEDFILSFGLENGGSDSLDPIHKFDQLRGLKVNDKIIIRSRSVSHAPKYSFPIIAGDHIERAGKVIYERPPNKGGC